MAHDDPDEHVRRQLRVLQRVVGAPTDAVLARRSGIAAATFSEVMSGKRRPRNEFVAKVVAGCLECARAGGQAPLDGEKIVRALRLPGHTAADSGILERDEDLRHCSAVLDAVRTRSGGAIVIEGPAGIGKSELVALVCAEAAARGITSFSVRGNPRDEPLAFGAVRGLLSHWAANLSTTVKRDVFAGAATLARVPLGLLPGPGLPSQDNTRSTTMIGLTEALYWFVVNATARNSADGLLLAVDDAHWLDEESLDWLEFLAERLAALPVVLLLACRPHEPRPALTRISLHATQVVRPQPLSHDAVRTLLSRGLAARAAAPDETFCAAFREHSGGNPFYLRWMLDVARKNGLRPTSAAAPTVSTLTPEHVVRYLNERLDGFGPAARQVAEAVAVLGPGSTLALVATLAQLPVATAKRQYDRLCAATILAPAPTLDFRHPIIRGAIYDGMPPSRRSDAHLAAARLLHQQQASPGTVAAHLLDVHADGDPWVVDQLSTAAADAMASGLSGTAARYLKRAVDEPPAGAEQARVHLRHGQALALGQLVAAIPELLTSYRLDGHADAAVALAKTYGYADQLGACVRFLDDAIDRSTDERSRQRLVAEQLLWAAWWAEDPHRDDRMRLLGRIAAPLTGATHVQRLLITLHAWSQVLRGEPRAAALATSQPVVRRGLVFADGAHGMEVATMTAFVHWFTGELTIAKTLFRQALTEFERDGWRGTHLAFAHTHLGNIALREGRLADAIADAGIALRLARRTGSGTPAEWFATGTLVQGLLARGDIAGASTVAAEHGYDRRRPDALILPIPQEVLGTLQAATGNTRQAVRTFRDLGNWLEAASIHNPAVCAWRLELASVLRSSAAREAYEIAAVAVRRADRFGDPAVLGRALRVLAGCGPEPDIDLLEESVRLLRNAPNRWEHLRSLAELGTALARSGRDARTVLTHALALADECGALAVWEAVARHLTAPTPPRRGNTLPPLLWRVAHLAADGHSPGEIAHNLVLDLEDVTELLSQAHERLGVTSLPELRDALGPRD